MTKIAIDIHPVVANVVGHIRGGHTKTGVGQYTYNLIRALLAIDDHNEYRLVSFQLTGSPKPFPQSPNVRYEFVRVPPGRVYRAVHRDLRVPLPIDIFTHRADIFVFPNFVRPPLIRTPRSIVFVYDLSFLRFPQFAHVRTRRYLGARVAESVERVDAVVTISNNIRDEIVAAFDVDPRKIIVAQPGVDRNQFRPLTGAAVENVRNRYALPREYILYVGTIEPRKNIEGIIGAFERLPQSMQARYPLVFVGGRGWQDDELLRKIERLKNGGHAVATGYVPDEDLPAIYSGAKAFVFPSFYEGWGIPIVEAMACGVPVITSDSPSVREAAGDAAMTAGPHDVDALGAAVLRVVEDEELREELVEKGLQRARRLSWNASASVLLKLLESVARR